MSIPLNSSLERYILFQNDNNIICSSIVFHVYLLSVLFFYLFKFELSYIVRKNLYILQSAKGGKRERYLCLYKKNKVYFISIPMPKSS